MIKKILILLITALLWSCEKQVYEGSVEPQEIESGKIFLFSNPPGFKIFVDNKYMGAVTPDTIRWLKSGIRKITLKNEWYLYDTTFNVNVRNDDIAKINIDLVNNPNYWGTISVSSQPSNAEILINGASTGFVTPKTISRLTPGFYQIKYTRSQCREDSVQIKIRGGEFMEVYKVLEDTSRTVCYRTNNSGITSNNLTKVIVDNYNNKWIGTFNKGLVKFDGKNWIPHNDNGRLGDAHITDLLMDRNNRLWISTTTGLSMYDGINYQILTSNLPSNTVNALEEDKNGNIWIATYKGLVKYSNGSFQVYNISNSPLLDDNISSIAALADGSIAIGTSIAGIYFFNGSVWKEYNIKSIFFDDKLSNFTVDMIQDLNGTLWAYVQGVPSEETRSSMLRYQNGYWEKFTLPLQFQVDVVSFNVDLSNTLWISSITGLVKYIPSQSARMYNTPDYNFYVKHTTSSSMDKNGDVWVATMGGGIIKFKKNNY